MTRVVIDEPTQFDSLATWLAFLSRIENLDQAHPDVMRSMRNARNAIKSRMDTEKK